MKHSNENGKGKKSKFAALACVGLAGIIGIGAGLAMFTDTDSAVNKFKYTKDDGSQLVDVEVVEPSFKESDALMEYALPISKDPSISVESDECYGFLEVVVPAAQVAIQNAQGEICDVSTGEKVASLSDIGFKTAYANNITAKDIANQVDETEILGIYKSEDCTVETAYSYGEEIEGGATIYFKLNKEATLGTLSADGTYKVLKDTLDADNGCSDILGHQFLITVVVDETNADKVQISELYATEIADDEGNAIRTNNISAKATKYDVNGTVDSDEDTEYDVYSKLAYNDSYVEITESIPQKTLMYDGSQWYSCHVFYYKGKISANTVTEPLFNYIELVNTLQGTLNSDSSVENLNKEVIVTALALQVPGTEDALGSVSDDTAEAGLILWNIATNSANASDSGYNLFAVTEDIND